MTFMVEARLVKEFSRNPGSHQRRNRRNGGTAKAAATASAANSNPAVGTHMATSVRSSSELSEPPPSPSPKSPALREKMAVKITATKADKPRDAKSTSTG